MSLSKFFELAMHTQGVLMRLCKSADHLYSSFLECSRSAYVLKLGSMVQVYIKVQLFHALRISNEHNGQAGAKKIAKC